MTNQNPQDKDIKQREEQQRKADAAKNQAKGTNKDGTYREANVGSSW